MVTGDLAAGHSADETIWQEVKAEAQTRARKGLAEYSSHFYGSDSDARVIERARSNARRAGIGELITFEVKDVAQLSNPLPKGPYGTVISNRLTANVWTANRR